MRNKNIERNRNAAEIAETMNFNAEMANRYKNMTV